MRSGAEQNLYDIHGTHRVDSLVSNLNQKFSLAINTQLNGITIFDESCLTCGVENKYSNYNSSTYE